MDYFHFFGSIMIILTIAYFIFNKEKTISKFEKVYDPGEAKFTYIAMLGFLCLGLLGSLWILIKSL